MRSQVDKFAVFSDSDGAIKDQRQVYENREGNDGNGNDPNLER